LMAVTRLVRIVLSCISFAMILAGTGAVAAESCQMVVGRLATAEGQVEVQRTGTPSWQTGVLGGDLCQGDTVRAGANSRATIVLVNQAVLRIDQNTAMRLDKISGVTTERSTLSLLKGAFQSFSRKPRGFEVSTPYLNGSIEGTEFVFRVKDKASELTVLEGVVVASNDQGSVSVSGGESATAQQGQAPQVRTVVRPRDAVQWSLYYPPVMVASTQASLQNAASLLSVGRVDEARAEIDKALQQDPNAGEAYALSAVINVAQNNNDQALTDANKAVALSPDSSAAKIALSYAQQAAFDIPGATDTLQQAVQQQPQDALAWARLSELQLMAGDRKQARASAEQAVALQPNIGRAQITLGFAALAEFRNDEAKAAFQHAIEDSSSDPLPHLGLGLATISAGDLEKGTGEIELAVALDSNDSLYRSYLGKAYFEEKRAPLDSEQFAIAKQLDPNDPTAYLYDGIAKQTENRPVEAVEDLEKSIELNDNRAVYRSRLLLDKDRASRGTSLARAYNDLGFTQLGINESTESLAVDPSNASAHRFLSDTYQGQRRREIARVSELLQAQLMQDININPIQPSVSATNLNIVTLGGPAAPGFNEFTPLFERNKTQFNATGFGGNEDTYGGEAVVSALYDQFSFSLGAFSYNSDGWRDNNDLDQKVYDAYAQWAITPQLNVQAEYRHQETESGDLAFNFDPDDFLEDRRLDTDRDTARLGLRYSPKPGSDYLLSYIYSDRKEKQSETRQPNPVTEFSLDTDRKTDGSLIEGQYIHQATSFNIVTGAAYSNLDTKGEIKGSIDITIPGLPPFLQPPSIPFDEKIREEVKHSRAYLYTNVDSHPGLTWTVGASVDDFKDEPIEETSFNPKLGVRWDINSAYQLRAAAFKILKPSLLNNRTIEPTQVAGFNQLFDDATGTESWRYGVALDSRLTRNISWGAEATWRDLEQPVVVLGTDDTDTEDQNEQFHRLYLNWTPMDRLALTSELVYDLFENDQPSVPADALYPEKVRTISLPLGANYFHPSGFFAGVLGTYVDQEVKSSISAEGDDNFFLVDVSVGYRFMKRRGIASLGVKNLFDTDFDYQDDSYREFSEDATTGPYFPKRLIMGRVTLNF
jgi:tetratricopeptide (TPR) repeat protein